MSPVSVAIVMLMMNAGAKHNTSLQIKKALNLDNFTDDDINKQMSGLLTKIKVLFATIESNN